MTGNFKNFDGQLAENLFKIATERTNQSIIPGENYIPVTGKVLDANDLLYGVDAVLDGRHRLSQSVRLEPRQFRRPRRDRVRFSAH